MDEYLSVIRQAANGQTYISREVALRLAKRASQIHPPSFYSVEQVNVDNTIEFSDREKEVLGLLAEGINNTAIAQKLYLSIGTVKNYISHIYSKLGARDRTHAIMLAKQRGLLTRE